MRSESEDVGDAWGWWGGAAREEGVARVSDARNVTVARDASGTRAVLGPRAVPGARAVSGARNVPGARAVSGARNVPGARAVSGARNVPGLRTVSGSQTAPGAGASMSSSSAPYPSWARRSPPGCCAPASSRERVIRWINSPNAAMPQPSSASIRTLNRWPAACSANVVTAQPSPDGAPASRSDCAML